MSADLEQASSQAWLDTQRAAERMLAKREAASLGSIPASVVTVPVVPQPVGNKTLAKEKPDPVANIPVKPLPVTGGQVRLTRVQGGVAKVPARTFREALMPRRPQVPVSVDEEAVPVSDMPTYKSVLSGAAAAPRLAPALDIIPMSHQEMSKDILKSLFRFPTYGENFSKPATPKLANFPTAYADAFPKIQEKVSRPPPASSLPFPPLRFFSSVPPPTLANSSSLMEEKIIPGLSTNKTVRKTRKRNSVANKPKTVVVETTFESVNRFDLLADDDSGDCDFFPQ